MDRHEFLTALHRVVRPRTYLEVGVNDGKSLALSRVPTVAIDPAFKVTKEISTDVHLVRATSDEFFARREPLARLPRPTVDLAFIDGMHLSEYALRDFMNIERHTEPGSVIMLDDMLPRDIDEAARDRHTKFWTGDVYKLLEALRRYRPDLIALEVNTSGSGTGLVVLPDASSTVLSEHYDDLVAEMVTPDPQDVPAEVLGRTRAVDPERIIDSPVWLELFRLRRRRRAAPRAEFEQVYAGADWARAAQPA